MHYGPIRAIVNYGEFIREFGEIKKQAERAQQEALRAANVCEYNIIRSTKLNISL
jgi:ubiquitin conjugation factor E4 B